MTKSIKILCIAASFTLFALSTVGLEMEDLNIKSEESCAKELVTQVEPQLELDTNP